MSQLLEEGHKSDWKYDMNVDRNLRKLLRCTTSNDPEKARTYTSDEEIF